MSIYNPKSHREGFRLMASLFLIPLCVAGAVVLVTKVMRKERMELSYIGLNTALIILVGIVLRWRERKAPKPVLPLAEEDLQFV
jgi:hypothetical protein